MTIETMGRETSSTRRLRLRDKGDKKPNLEELGDGMYRLVRLGDTGE